MRSFRARISPPSLPVRPTAWPPKRLIIVTSSPCISPASTHSTTSMVSASVTRMPWMKVDFLPTRSSASSICGPPPCTTTGFMPTSLRSTTSCAKASFRSWSTIALPPYFTTIVLPWKRRIYGSASDRISAFICGAICALSMAGDALCGRVARDRGKRPAGRAHLTPGVLPGRRDARGHARGPRTRTRVASSRRTLSEDRPCSRNSGSTACTATAAWRA